MNISSLFESTPNRVRAICNIVDSPLAKVDCSAKRGDVGDVEDVADGYYWVDFGFGAIACSPNEVVSLTGG